MNKRDTGFRKRACKKRTKQNCHLFWRKIISKLPRQYTHMITRDTTYETIFFATKHSTWLLFVNTQLGLHHITCFKPYPPQSAEWTIWVQFLRCDAFLFLPLKAFRWLLFLSCNCNFVGQQFLNEAMTSAHLASLLSPPGSPPWSPLYYLFIWLIWIPFIFSFK